MSTLSPRVETPSSDMPTITLINDIIAFRASGEDVRLMLWDTAGQEEFDAITKAYYRGAQAGVHILQKMHEIYWRFEKKEL